MRRAGTALARIPGLRLLVVVVGLVVVSAAAAPAGAAKAKQQKPDANATVMWGGASQVGVNWDVQKSGGTLGEFPYDLLVYDQLLGLNAAATAVVPRLVESYKFDAAGTTLTLNLRKDVKFQDGSPLNAAAVVTNLKRQQETGSNGAQAFSAVTAITTTEPNVVQMTMSAPNPAIVFQLANVPGIIVNPAAFTDANKLKTTPSGSGPYKLTDVDASLTYTYDRNPDYWDKSHQYPAHFKVVQYLDENARLNAIRTNAIQGAWITAVTYPTATSDKSIDVAKFAGFSPLAFLMNDSMAPFDKPEVRQAVNIGMDRAAISAALNGACPALNQALAEGMLGHVSSISLKPDVAKAKDMLTKAGVSGVTFKALVLNVEPYITMGNVVQAQMKTLGLNMEQVLIAGQLGRPTYRTGQYPALVGTVNGGPDPAPTLDTFALGIENPGTVTKNDATFTQMIATARVKPLGSADRKKGFEDVERYLQDKPIWASLCAPLTTFAHQKALLNVEELPWGHSQAAPQITFLQVAKTK